MEIENSRECWDRRCKFSRYLNIFTLCTPQNSSTFRPPLHPSLKIRSISKHHQIRSHSCVYGFGPTYIICMETKMCEFLLFIEVSMWIFDFRQFVLISGNFWWCFHIHSSMKILRKMAAYLTVIESSYSTCEHIAYGENCDGMKAKRPKGKHSPKFE